MTRIAIIYTIVIYVIGCGKPGHNVGDIKYNEALDDPNFELCNERTARQYYARQSTDEPGTFQGEKPALEKIILDQYSHPVTKDQNGFVTIRFVINCQGKTGRFRVEEMDLKMIKSSFDSAVTQQLLDIVKRLNGWIPRRNNTMSFDTYQYLTFKIEQGQITHISP